MAKQASDKRNDSRHPTGGQAPTRYAVMVPHTYFVGDEKKTSWTIIGSAWPSRNGAGFNIEIRENITVGGRIIVRPVNIDEDSIEGAAAALGAARGFSYNPSQPDDELV
jgi:hypothetical protein